MTGTYTQTRTEVVLSQLEALPKLSVRFEMPDTVVSFVCFLDKSFGWLPTYVLTGTSLGTQPAETAKLPTLWSGFFCLSFGEKKASWIPEESRRSMSSYRLLLSRRTLEENSLLLSDTCTKDLFFRVEGKGEVKIMQIDGCRYDERVHAKTIYVTGCLITNVSSSSVFP
jgi:hypothetical protein